MTDKTSHYNYYLLSIIAHSMVEFFNSLQQASLIAIFYTTLYFLRVEMNDKFMHNSIIKSILKN